MQFNFLLSSIYGKAFNRMLLLFYFYFHTIHFYYRNVRSIIGSINEQLTCFFFVAALFYVNKVYLTQRLSKYGTCNSIQVLTRLFQWSYRTLFLKVTQKIFPCWLFLYIVNKLNCVAATHVRHKITIDEAY